MTKEELLAARERCKRDKLYLAEIMGNDFVEAVHAELFAQYIPFNPDKPWAEQSDIYKRLILWPRGHFKSRSIQVEIVQIILNFPDIRILIMQGSVLVTQNLLHEILAHFTGENTKSRLKELFPEFCGVKDLESGEWTFGKKVMQATLNKFTTPARKNKGLAQATVTVASPKSVKTGQHYDVGFFDDLVNDQNYRSPRLLQKVKEDFNMCMPLIDPPFFAYVSGTRYAFGDLYEEIIRSNTNNVWKVSLKDCWTDDRKGVRFQQCKTKDGRVIGFTREGLLQIQQDDPEMFASQYLNQPIQRGGQRFSKPLMESALIAEHDVPPLSQSIMVVDLAAVDAIKADDSCIVVAATDVQMNQYVQEVRGGQWNPATTAQNIIELALKYRPSQIRFEKTASCIYFVDYLRMVTRSLNIFLPIDFIKVDNRDDAKYTRIAALEGLIKSKKLRFFVGITRWDRLVEQFGKFPGGKNQHDDYPDTVALMSNLFNVTAAIQPLRRRNPHTILAMIEQREQQLAFVPDGPPDPDDGAEGFLSF